MSRFFLTHILPVLLVQYSTYLVLLRLLLSGNAFSNIFVGSKLVCLVSEHGLEITPFAYLTMFFSQSDLFRYF
ncbi:hypothetical protein VNO77_43819 [Canavalia gladiata]|uniref:Uncharacterized protein n=1 Tax=Canavalia gladiata TaxID=3824 RepID=A0AAN9JVI2_CANGL